MKLVVVVTVLSAVFMVALIVQAVRQEMNLREVKHRMEQNTMEVKRKEAAIIEMKANIDTLTRTLDDANRRVGSVKQKNEEIASSTRNSEDVLRACNKDKGKIVDMKTEKTKVIAQLRADHEEAKKKAEADIQSLKQQILDRDKAVCAFADTSKEEARKLCGITETSQ
ncbi:uncharacterized protein si:dkey-87o1.2 [Cheilinus undulatus]|uniref:uncharacterized protein si:dkey-87o1.2 n=1 Tax=Cheilinus undulatus TaxID=241271 RepID=UPI001BD5108D|nr:uncharacterized protein si:dkey-87o1.2 [Cheilinus undulatus]